MPRGLPPLNALRAFEAAARHLSFARAADELFVTPAAVSHQVKGLEAYLGDQLFHRQPNGLALTDAGRMYLPPLSEAFATIAEATRRLASRRRRGLSVSVQMSLAAKWLVPRLYRFQERYPEIDVWVSASDALVDFARDPIDCALRWGPGGYDDLAMVSLAAEDIFPVCRPELLQGANALRRPEDLLKTTLFWDEYASLGAGREGGRRMWGRWLEAAGQTDALPDRGISASHALLTLQMALEGRGVALGRGFLVADDLQAGRLVRPFAAAIPCEWTYWFVAPKDMDDAARPDLVRFREWLFEEAATTSAFLAGHKAALPAAA